MRSCWGKLAIGFGLLLILLVGLWLYFDIKYQHMINVELTRIRAEGWPVTAAECAPEPVPDAQNAAVLYQQVFQIDFDAPDPWAGSDLLPDIDSDLIRTFREEPTSEIERQVQTLLANPETTKVLEILRQASERPYSVFAIHREKGEDRITHAFLHLAKFREACYLISLRALASARAGRIREALDWCRIGLRMSEHVAAEHTLIAELVSIAMNSITIREAEGFLDTGAVSPQDARQMENYLRQIDLRAHFTNAMITERALGLAEFRVFHDNPTICYYTFCPQYPDIPEEFSEMFPGCRDLRSKAAARTYCSRLAWPLQKLDELYYLTIMREQIEFSKQPYHLGKTRYDAQQQALEDMPSYQVPVTRILTSVHGRAAAKRDYSIAQIALFRVVLALKAYKYEHRAYPKSLAQLQQTLSWQLPQDPFSGNSFVYRREGKGFKLYSLWSDLDDDGGEPIEKHRYEDGDIVWECHR